MRLSLLARVALALGLLLAFDVRPACGQQKVPPAFVISADFQSVSVTPWAVQEFGIGPHANGFGITVAMLIRKTMVVGIETNFWFPEDRAHFTQDVQLCTISYGSERCGESVTRGSTLMFAGAGLLLGVRHDFAFGSPQKGMAVTPMLAAGYALYAIDRAIWQCADCRADLKSTWQGWVDGSLAYGFGPSRRFEAYVAYRRSHKTVDSALRIGGNLVIPIIMN